MNPPIPIEEIRFDDRGLVPAVIQDAVSGEVLTVGYMNLAALQKTLESATVHFYSPSRRKLRVHGEGSGRLAEIEAIYTDCDADALVIRARQIGAACHLGYRSCFYRKLEPDGHLVVIDQPLAATDEPTSEPA